MSGNKLGSETIFQKISTTYKTIASPIRCPHCGAYPNKPVSEIEPNRIFRCGHCGADYIVEKSLDEKTINQLINSILKDFSSIVTEDIKNNIGQMIIFYHQNLVNEIEKQMQDQKDITFALIQNAYKTVDQHMSALFEIKSDLKAISSQQKYFMSKSEEQYQTLLEQTQLIVNLIRQHGGSIYRGKTSFNVEEKPKRKLKHTDYNPEEFTSV